MNRLSRIVLGISVGAVGTTVVAAQQDDPAGFALEEVVVTAERRENSLQDTPISVLSVSAEAIEQTGAGGLDQLQSFLPNVNIVYDSAYGRANPQFNIRGVGSGVVTSGVVTERSVGLYIDGLYYARSQGALLSLIDAERIDVLRGPQGTLFGRNTTGGAIAYTSKAPSREFGGEVKAKVGQFNQRSLQVMLNTPLGDMSALRFSAASQEQDGYVSRGSIDLGNVDDDVARLQLKIMPTDNVDIDLAVSHSKSKTDGDARDIYEFDLAGLAAPGNQFLALDTALRAHGEPGLVQNDPRLLLDSYSVPNFCLFDDPNPLTFSPDCETKMKGEMDVLSSKIVWGISDTVSLTSITGYLSGKQSANSDWVWTGGYYRPVSHDFDNYSQELQLNWDAERLKFVAGVVYFHEDANEIEYTDEVIQNNRLSAAQILAGERIHRRDEDYRSVVDSYGVFTQATYSLTEKLDLTAGLRYSEDNKEVTINYNPTLDDPRDETGLGEDSWSDTDWRLAATYNFSNDVMVYASVTDAYKAGIADDSSIENRSNTDNIILFIPPESALGYEVGFRSEWFDNRLRLNASAYKTEYTNRQSTEVRTDAISGFVTVVSVNLGDVDFQGVEADFAFAVTENLRVNGSLGISDYEQIDAPDEVLANVPKHSWTLGLTHGIILNNGATVDSSLTYGWTDEAYARAGAKVGPRQAVNPSYGLLSGRLQYAHNENWSVALYGTNLLDKQYSSSASAQNYHIGWVGTVRARYMGRPRSIGLEVKHNF